MTVVVSPITEDDLPGVAEFLHAEFPHGERESKQTWQEGLYSPWGGDQPNWGLMAHDGDSIVGVYVAHYSEQEIDGRRERFCNLGVWHVLPDHRMQSFPLMKAMLSQDGYHFTDLTPAENVVAINTRLGFETIDTRAVVVPCLPWPTFPSRTTIASDPVSLERMLEGADLDRYLDHRRAGGLHHVAIAGDGRCCYVVLRPDRHRGLPVLIVLYVSDPGLLRRNGRRFARHLLIRHRVPAYIAELRLAHYRPRPSFALRNPPIRMFRSDRLQAGDIGYLYSELVCVPE